jgi:hypothetical protein
MNDVVEAKIQIQVFPFLITTDCDAGPGGRTHIKAKLNCSAHDSR